MNQPRKGDESPPSPKEEMHRRDFVLGGIQVSLSFLALGASRLSAFAQSGGAAGPSAPLDDSLRILAAYLAKYAPPDGNFPANGAWAATYDLISWTGQPGNEKTLTGNRVLGHLTVTRRPGRAGAGPGYDLDYAINLNGFESRLKSTMECSAGPMPGLVTWKTDYENHSLRKPGPTAKLSERGSCAAGVMEITSASGTQQIRTDRPVLPQWAVMDALRGATVDPSGPIPDAEFDLLFDLTSYRPHQRLQSCGGLSISLDGKPYTLHGFIQTGYGTEPTHYWLDESGRPLLITGGLLSSALTSLRPA